MAGRRRQPERLDRRGRAALRSGPPAHAPRLSRQTDPMEPFDFVIIGAGPAGEAAAYEARSRGATVAVIDRRWFGGSCPHIGCLPSKSLLHGAAEHAANPARYSWERASAARDYMVNRPADAAEPDDSSHVQRLEDAGAVCYRGTGRIAGRGLIEIRHDDEVHEIRTPNVLVAIGSQSRVPSLPGLDGVRIWTNREATLARELPKSLLVLGGGPTGCELSQVYVRFGVPVTIVQSGDRLMPTEHPRNSEAVAQLLRRDGVDLRLGVRATGARAGAGSGRRRRHRPRRRLDGRGHAILLAVGRTFPLDDLGLEHYGIDTSERRAFPARRAAARRRRAVGHRRPGRPRAPHPPGPLPGRARDPDGDGPRGPPRLPGPSAGDLHRSRGRLGRADARAGEGRRASTRSSTWPTSRRRRAAMRSRRRSAT